MLLGLILVAISPAVRGVTLNRHIRRRATTSAALFAAYALVAIVFQRVPLDPAPRTLLTRVRRFLRLSAA